MTYVLALATEATRDLVVAALTTAGEQRTRVALKAAAAVAELAKARKDVRSRAVKVTALLADAAELGDLAATLKAATPLVEHRGPAPDLPTPAPVDVDSLRTLLTGEEPTAEDPDVPPDPDDDDGTSPEAQRLAALAGLEPAVEDPLTGSIPEDEPTDAELGDVTL